MLFNVQGEVSLNDMNGNGRNKMNISQNKRGGNNNWNWNWDWNWGWIWKSKWPLLVLLAGSGLGVCQKYISKTQNKLSEVEMEIRLLKANDERHQKELSDLNTEIIHLRRIIVSRGRTNPWV
ncbi:hypothetical protein IRJ41_020348 [Triplophysa rosa]|uniref:Uncharacterized protein n=1 Tax=Triplophysa rosa TaxID=992332 RepID=A0A9W7WF74_TRIRA|nr:hypothetical protein IRJ41_020348 [Triplophysa rosa]